jgi:hypothetical protein
MRLCVTGNFNSSEIKDLCDIAIEGSAKPGFTVGYADYPNVQITDLTEDDYTDQEGVMYASFLCDRLSPNASGSADEKMYEGDPVKDIALKVMCEFQKYDSLMFVNFINIGYEISRGHKQILEPINS